MKTNPVIVFVADNYRSEAFMKDSDLVTFGVNTFRAALSQVIFSYPDVIVIDASDDMLRAEDTFFHLRTINHPPIIVLSNVPNRWEMNGGNPVIVLPEDTPDYQLEEMIRVVLTGDTTAIF